VITAVDPDEARAEARDILGDRRFQSEPAPRPLRGVLKWIGDRLEPVADFFNTIPWFIWLLIAIGLLAFLVTVLAPRLQARRAGRSGGVGTARPAKAEDPDALEREAVEAERAGDYERAVRLRFRAGLLRLGKRGTIEYRPSVTVGEVRRAVASDDFEHLAETFEEVAYGDRDAGQPEVDESRRDWPHVIERSPR